MRQHFFRKLFGQRLRTLRQEQKMTGRFLAELADRGKSWVSQVESGKYATGLDTISLFAEVLGIDELDLLTFPENNIRHAVIDLTRKVPRETLYEVRELLLKASQEAEKRKQKQEQLRASSRSG